MRVTKSSAGHDIFDSEMEMMPEDNALDQRILLESGSGSHYADSTGSSLVDSPADHRGMRLNSIATKNINSQSQV